MGVGEGIAVAAGFPAMPVAGALPAGIGVGDGIIVAAGCPCCIAGACPAAIPCSIGMAAALPICLAS